MNPYQLPVYCSLCGGRGNAHIKDARYLFGPSEFFHRDPRVCKEVLENRKRDEKKAA